MRHYFGYDINGILRSYESYGPVGWPAGQCLADPNCEHISVTSLRESRALTDQEIVGWALFDCDCDPAGGELLKDCKCVNQKYSESYVDTETKLLRPKPLRTVYVDGVVISDRDVIVRDPGTQVVFKVVSAGVATGEKVKCSQGGTVDVAPQPQWEMTFVGGSTEEKVLITPAQGTRGSVFIGGDRVRPFVFQLRGFAGA